MVDDKRHPGRGASCGRGIAAPVVLGACLPIAYDMEVGGLFRADAPMTKEGDMAAVRLTPRSQGATGVKSGRQRLPGLGTCGLLALLAAACSPPPEAGPRCGDAAYHWSATDPSINLRHVFCGDTNRRGRAVGFHAILALGQPGVPALILDSIEPDGRDRTETFTADIRFPDGQTKFSTFFPEACSEAEIIASILYAQERAEPTEPWGFVGPSAPGAGGDGGYCLADGAPFPVRFGTLDDGTGRINTAFPQ